MVEYAKVQQLKYLNISAIHPKVVSVRAHDDCWQKYYNFSYKSVTHLEE